MGISYDQRIRKAFREIPKPFPGINLDLGINGSQYELIIYEDQVMSLNTVQREQFMLYVISVRDNIAKYGFTVEIVAG